MTDTETIQRWAKTDDFAKQFLENIPLLKELYAQSNITKTVSGLNVNGQKCKLQVTPIEQYDRDDIIICIDCNRKPENCKCGGHSTGTKSVHGTSWACYDIHYKGAVQSAAKCNVQRAPWDMDSINDMEPGKIYEVEGEYSVYQAANGKEYTSIKAQVIKPISKQESIEPVQPQQQPQQEPQAQQPHQSPQEYTPEPTQSQPQESQESQPQQEPMIDQCRALMNHEYEMQSKISAESYTFYVKQFGDVMVKKILYELNLEKRGDGSFAPA